MELCPPQLENGKVEKPYHSGSTVQEDLGWPHGGWRVIL